MSRLLLLLLLALVTLPAAPASATATPPEFRWGRTGHRIVARVAASQLTPRTKERVRELLGRETLASVAAWGDEIRSERPATANWHYVNIPLTDSRYIPARHCAEGCIFTALATQMRVLADRNAARSDRADALKWVVHLIGDLHQPLHVGERGDRGGNDVKLTWQGKPSNLHRLWDSQLIEEEDRSEDAWVTRFEREIARRGDLAAIRSGTPIDWGMESHAISRDVAYPFLPTSLMLDREYFEQVHSVMDDQLFRAGVRLASVLNEILGGR